MICTMKTSLTYIRVKKFFNNELEEFLWDSALINALLTFKLYEQLLLQVLRVLQSYQLQLQVQGQKVN